MKAAALFPGQGAQYVGMGKDLSYRFPEAREVFDRADEVLGWQLSAVCFSGPQEKLNATDVSQPALLATSIAVLRSAWGRGGLDKVSWEYTAGLSLGEYTALVFANALDLEAALKLVYQRGRFMQEACDGNPGGMVCVLGLEAEQVKAICREAGSAGTVVAANFNCPGQVVISGERPALALASELARARGARLIELQVAGAFHSPLMAPAAAKLRAALAEVEIRAPKVPVVSNVSGEPTSSPEVIREHLGRQITSPVVWQQSVEHMLAEGTTEFYEIGAGKVLAGLIRRIDRGAKIYNIDSATAVEALAASS